MEFIENIPSYSGRKPYTKNEQPTWWALGWKPYIKNEWFNLVAIKLKAFYKGVYHLGVRSTILYEKKKTTWWSPSQFPFNKKQPTKW